MKMAGRREESEVARLAKRPPFFPTPPLCFSVKRENPACVCPPQNEPDAPTLTQFPAKPRPNRALRIPLFFLFFPKQF